MDKGTNFIGLPLLTQLLKFFDKDKILRMSRKCGGERYVKGFDGWHHLVVMLYAVLMRFDSLREITASTLAEARKLNHLGITMMPRRSTLSKKGLKYKVLSDVMYMEAKSGMAYRIQEVEFTKKKSRKADGNGEVEKDAPKEKNDARDENSNEEVITHRARIITYPDVKKSKGKGGKEVVKGKMASLLTNDFTTDAEDIIAIYKKRWEIETLFYDKYIIMQSKVRSVTDNQIFVRLLLTSTSHNNSQCPRSLSQSRRSLLFSQALSESRLGTRSAYAFSSASRLAFESATIVTCL